MLTSVVAGLQVQAELRVVGIGVLEALQQGASFLRLVEAALDEREV